MQQYFQQVVTIWRGLSQSQKLGLGAIGAAALALAVTFTTVGRGPDMAVAFSGLNDEEAAGIVAKLKESKIPYTLGERGVIRVPGALVNEVKLMGAGQGLGGKPASGAGFEMFNQPSFGMTEFAQKVNYQRALEAELARSIGRMDAVESARVHLTTPQPSLFASKQQVTTASVILKLKPGKQVDRGQVRAISNLVAGSVEGLKKENLAIVDVNGNTLSDDDSQAGNSALSTKQMEMQRGYESSMERQLQEFADRAVGPGKAAVRVSALLDWDQQEETRKIFAPSNSAEAPVRSRKEYEENQSGRAATQAGGVPGPDANNGAVPSYQGALGAGQGAYEKRETQTNYDLSETFQKVTRAPGAVKRLNVSVLLDQAAVDGPQAEAIRAALATAAGIDTQGRGDQIAVVAFPFNRAEMEQVQTVMAATEQREQVLGWARLAALVLGPLLMLIVLRFILGSRPRETVRTPSLAQLQQAALATATASAAPLLRPTLPPRVEDPHAQIREHVHHLARTNPATVAQLIQTWIDEDRRN